MRSQTLEAEIRADLVPSHVTPPIEVPQGLTVRGREDEIIGRVTLDAGFQHSRYGAGDRDLPCLFGFWGCGVEPAAYFRGALDHGQPVRSQVYVANAKRREL